MTKQAMTATLFCLRVCNLGGLMKKSTLKRIIGFSVLIPVITGVLVFLYVVTGIGLEFLSVKWDIDNPYVDKHFREWKKVSIDGLEAFRIPEGWAINQESQNAYFIYDASGQVWARGAFYTKDNYIQPLEQLLSFPITDIYFDAFLPIYMMNGSDTGQITVCNNDVTKSYQEIRFFITVETGFIWVLEHDISVDMQQCDIAEAMQYSYAFQK